MAQETSPPRYWVDAFVALSISAPILIPLGGEATMLLLSLLGAFFSIVLFATGKLTAYTKISWRLVDAQLAICMASMFVLPFTSVLWAQWPLQAVASALKHLHFLMWPLVVVVLSMSRRTPVVFGWALVLTLLTCFLWILGLATMKGWQSLWRFEAAAQNASVFGRIVAVYGLWALLLATRPNLTDQRSFPPRWLLALATLASLVAVVSSGNRIELVAFMVLALVLIIWRMLQWGRWRVILGMGGTLLLAVVFSAQSIGARMDEGAKDVRSYFAQAAPKAQDLQTSVGLRIEMYYIAIRAISERPWFGWGAGSRPQNFRHLSHHPEQLPSRTHLHSQYLQVLTDVGVVGAMLALCTTLVAIWATVIRPWKTGHSEMAALFAALMGMHLISGVFNPAFSQGLSNSFFVMMVALLWVMLRQQEAST
jgi:O-antigen ligase